MIDYLSDSRRGAQTTATAIKHTHAVFAAECIRKFSRQKLDPCFCRGSEFFNRRDATVRDDASSSRLPAYRPAPPCLEMEAQHLLQAAFTHTCTPHDKQQAVTLT